MNRIKMLANKVGVWWMLKFRNTLIGEIEFDAYKVTFRKFTMDIITKSGNFKMSTMMMLYPNSFLFNALEKGDDKVIKWFCNNVYSFVTLFTSDMGLAQDINKAFAKYYKRMDKKSESLAKDISEEADALAMEQLEFEREYAKKSKEERKAYKEAMREELRNKDE